MKGWIEAVGYQAVWFAAVVGAARGSYVPGVAAALAFIACHLLWATRLRQEVLLIVAGFACGLLVDGGLVRAGLVAFGASPARFDVLGAPPWIFALWVCFALTLSRSLAVLQHRPALAALLGAIGAPLAYAGASRGWDVVTFADPAWQSIAALGLGWAIALPVLALIARNGAPPVRAAVVPGTPA
ncbi:MAG: DUF2878 domain-containing protein [Lysobacter sp.]|nr:MAG: DUF2878 domain-containing protein [Lysobacter sp.]